MRNTLPLRRPPGGGEHAFALGLEIDLNSFNIAEQFLRRAGFEHGDSSGVSARVKHCDGMAYLSVSAFGFLFCVLVYMT